jgi:hypothetical protein
MMRPHEAKDVTIDTSALAVFLGPPLGAEPAMLEAALAVVVSGRPEDAEAALRSFTNALPAGPVSAC